MTSIVFNGSYITKKNTGIGVVSRDLVNYLSDKKRLIICTYRRPLEPIFGEKTSKMVEQKLRLRG